MCLLNFCCDIYHKNQKVGRLEIINNKLVKNEVYTNNLLLHPFPRTKTLMGITSALKERVICKERATKEILDSMGLKEYNVYAILRNTHGVDTDDFIWFKYDGEDITWDDVRVR